MRCKSLLTYLLAALLAVPAVLATQCSNLILPIRGLCYVFIDLNAMGVAGDDLFVMYMRVAIFILVFAIFYYGIGKAFGATSHGIGALGATNTRGMAKNLRVVISLVLALIATIGIPSSILLSIVQTYGILIGVILMLLPAIVAWILVWNNFPEDNSKDHFLRGIIYLMLAWLMGTFTAALSNSTSQAYKDMSDWIAWMVVVFFILAIYNLILAISGGHEAPGQTQSGTTPTRPTTPAGETPEIPTTPTPNGPPSAPHTPPGGRPAGHEPPEEQPPQGKADDPPTPPEGPPDGVLPPPRPVNIPRAPERDPIPDNMLVFRDLSPFFNLIRSQDSLGACTAFASTSIFEYLRRHHCGIQPSYLSPLFVWFKSREAIGEPTVNTGVPSVIAMQTLLDSGVSFEQLWAFEGSASAKWRMRPNDAAHSDAEQKCIVDFNSLDRTDPDSWAWQIWYYNPIYIAVDVPADWKGNYSKQFYDNFSPNLNGKYHAMVIVGYHSHYPYKGHGVKAFKIRNSWGIGWGHYGYTWVPAETLMNMLSEDPMVMVIDCNATGAKHVPPKVKKEEGAKVGPPGPKKEEGAAKVETKEALLAIKTEAATRHTLASRLLGPYKDVAGKLKEQNYIGLDEWRQNFEHNDDLKQMRTMIVDDKILTLFASLPAAMQTRYKGAIDALAVARKGWSEVNAKSSNGDLVYDAVFLLVHNYFDPKNQKKDKTQKEAAEFEKNNHVLQQAVAGALDLQLTALAKIVEAYKNIGLIPIA